MPIVELEQFPSSLPKKRVKCTVLKSYLKQLRMRRNAELNGMSNVEFAVGEAETVIPEWYENGVVADVFVVDPPRKGCDEKLSTDDYQYETKKSRLCFL